MSITALVIHPDATTEVCEIEPGFENFKEVVGGWLEGVGAGIDADWLAYADEEGRLKQLPVNERATALARALGWSGDLLVGPVVFVGQARDGEDGMVEVDVPARLIEAVAH